MKIQIDDTIFENYENTKVIKYKDVDYHFENTYKYSEIKDGKDLHGVLKMCQYVGDDLCFTFSDRETHVAVIAATRVGKTTSYVIPMLHVFALYKQKRSLFITDPKGELYRIISPFLEEHEYRIRLLNYRDYRHSEYWNFFSDIFHKYQSIDNLEDEVSVVDTPHGKRNCYRGQIYEDQKDLDLELELNKMDILDEVGVLIDKLASQVITVESFKDPYWEQAAGELFKAFLWGMLEDTHPTSNRPRVTEETFNFNTLITLVEATSGYYDQSENAYFRSRPYTSYARQYAQRTILGNAKNTAQCIISILGVKLAPYKNTSIRHLTSFNTLDLSELVDPEHPVAVFIVYQDEVKDQYQVISTYIQKAYEYLITYATNRKDGKLEVPFYFVLDEFGNVPRIPDFDTTISACGGRNIFFILILQSYAQLDNVYGGLVSKIIQDNLNMHVFLGSNNMPTVEQFRNECGSVVRFSPVNFLNGDTDRIQQYTMETVYTFPISQLRSLKRGECVITEANTGYVLFSMLVPYYQWKEWSNIKTADFNDYIISSEVKEVINKCEKFKKEVISRYGNH